MYRFWASRRRRFPPFRQEDPQNGPFPPQSQPRAPIPPAEPAQSGLVLRKPTKHNILRTIFDTLWGPQSPPLSSSPPPFPCLGRALRCENHQKHKGTRGSHPRVEKSPRGVRMGPIQKRASQTVPNPSATRLKIQISTPSIQPCPPFRAGRRFRALHKNARTLFAKRGLPSRLVQDDGSRKLPQTITQKSYKNHTLLHNHLKIIWEFITQS